MRASAIYEPPFSFWRVYSVPPLFLFERCSQFPHLFYHFMPARHPFMSVTTGRHAVTFNDRSYYDEMYTRAWKRPMACYEKMPITLIYLASLASRRFIASLYMGVRELLAFLFIAFIDSDAYYEPAGLMVSHCSPYISLGAALRDSARRFTSAISWEFIIIWFDAPRADSQPYATYSQEMSPDICFSLLTNNIIICCLPASAWDYAGGKYKNRDILREEMPLIWYYSRVFRGLRAYDLHIRAAFSPRYQFSASYISIGLIPLSASHEMMIHSLMRLYDFPRFITCFIMDDVIISLCLLLSSSSGWMNRFQYFRF